jgi:hypothetical protein
MTQDMDGRVIGWREWVALPALGVPRIKAKIDTGARSSSLHVFGLQTEHRRGVWVARFGIHPAQRETRTTIWAEAPVLEFRKVRSSSGHAGMRPVIETDVTLLGQTWRIELTLANRDAMGFRMLLGREAIRRRFWVDPGRSYYGGRPKRKKKKKKKKKKAGKVKARRRSSP